MMNRRLFLRLLLALSAAVGMSGSVLLLLERLGLLDSAQRPQIEAHLRDPLRPRFQRPDPAFVQHGGNADQPAKDQRPGCG